MEFWHLINRGVDKRVVYKDEKDYVRFIRSMYLFNDSNYVVSTTRKNIHTGKTELVQKRELLLQIHAYSLMPNHYHILVSTADGASENVSLFMKKLNKGYAQAFNKRHNRTGALWQGKYKKIQVTKDSHFSHLPFYIHCNPLDLFLPEWRKGDIQDTSSALDFLQNYRWSSHLDYLGIKNFLSVIHKEKLIAHNPLLSEKRYKNALVKLIGDNSLSKINDFTNSK